MKKVLFLSILFFNSFFGLAINALAQNNSTNLPVDNYQAIIQARDIVKIGEMVHFDALSSVVNNEPMVYRWDFADGNRDEGTEVSHIYNRAGNFKVLLEMKNTKGERVSQIEKEIFVYDKVFLLITDNYNEQEKIDSLYNYAKNQGIYLKIVGDYQDEISDFLSEELLTRKLSESWDDFPDTDRIIVWTKSSIGLTLLSRFKQISINNKPDFKGKNIIFISNRNLSTLYNIAIGTFNTVNPEKMVLSGEEALWPLIDAENVSNFINDLKNRGIEYRVIENGKANISILNFMSIAVNFMIDKGIPSNTVKLILVLPIIVTLVAFMKQVVGMTTLGVYTPSIITLSFIALDLKFGLIILIILLIMGSITRYVLRRYRLLYIPRMAILLTLVSLTIFGILVIGSYFNISELVSISIFPMLIMSTLVEKFVNIQTGQGFKSALFLMSETILVSIICYFVAEWDLVKTLMMGYPELTFLLLLINILLGRWTGLRIFEYFRFREVFKHAEEE